VAGEPGQTARSKLYHITMTEVGQQLLQVKAVAEYLAKRGVAPKTPGFYNPEGRAYPDMAAYGSNYFVYLNGSITRESGTSASTPVVSAMVTLWNDLLLAHGKQPLGFVNPLMYFIWAHYPEAFFDVTTGNISCAAGHDEVNCCPQAFRAAPGWDAATGDWHGFLCLFHRVFWWMLDVPSRPLQEWEAPAGPSSHTFC
jgi:hypothetical protein